MLRPICLMTILTGLTACATFPELDATASAEARRAGFPDLLPITDIIARAGEPSQPAEQAVADLEARSARLRARAALLRRPVIDAETLEAMRAALARQNGG